MIALAVHRAPGRQVDRVDDLGAGQGEDHGRSFTSEPHGFTRTVIL